MKLYSNETDGFKVKTGHKLRLQSKAVIPLEEAQTVSPDESYDGLSSATVEAAPLQVKTVSPSEQAQEITADSEFFAMKKVNVEAARLQEKETKSSRRIEDVTIYPDRTTIEVLPDEGYYGLSKVTVNPVKLISQTIQPSEERYTITPGNYDGFYQIEVYPARLEEKTVKSDANFTRVIMYHNKHSFNPNNYYGCGKIIVEPFLLQNKTVTPTEEQQIITADSGYDALGVVTISAARLTPKITRID